MLDAAAPEQAVGVAGDVARGVHVVGRRPQLRVDVHAVVHRQPGVLRQVGGDLDTETAHDGIRADLVTVLEVEAGARGIHFSSRDLRTGDDLDAGIAEELLEPLASAGGNTASPSTAPVWISTVSTSFCTRAAASSEPMYPPPTTAMRSTSFARARRRR